MSCALRAQRRATGRSTRCGDGCAATQVLQPLTYDVKCCGTQAALERCTVEVKYVVCSYCDRTRKVNADGTIRKHESAISKRPCNGSGTDASGHVPSPIYLGRRS